MNRSKPLRPAIPPLTPDPKTVEPLTYAEVVNQNNYATYLLKQERRRHAAVERFFVKSLDELQTALDRTREAFFQQAAPKPTQGSRQ